MSPFVELADVAAQCLALLDELEPYVQAAQEAYRDGGINYCQLPPPHDAPPVDGNPEPCDWTRTVDDVGLSWAASDIAGLLPTHLPCSPRCDVWAAGDHSGYRITLEIYSSGTDSTWEYAREYLSTGETRIFDWVEITPGDWPA